MCCPIVAARISRRSPSQGLRSFCTTIPKGWNPGAFGKQIEGCEVFVEATGRAGDVYLIHPYMLHSAAPNPSGRPRFITNPPVAFKEPMNFNREDLEDFSLVEKVVLNALGAKRLDYQIAGERERYYTEFRRERERMLVKQKARLVALGCAKF